MLGGVSDSGGALEVEGTQIHKSGHRLGRLAIKIVSYTQRLNSIFFLEI